MLRRIEEWREGENQRISSAVPESSELSMESSWNQAKTENIHHFIVLMNYPSLDLKLGDDK